MRRMAAFGFRRFGSERACARAYTAASHKVVISTFGQLLFYGHKILYFSVAVVVVGPLLVHSVGSHRSVCSLKCSFVICAFVLDFLADAVIYFDLCAITLARFSWHFTRIANYASKQAGMGAVASKPLNALIYQLIKHYVRCHRQSNRARTFRETVFNFCAPQAAVPGQSQTGKQANTTTLMSTERQNV